MNRISRHSHGASLLFADDVVLVTSSVSLVSKMKATALHRKDLVLMVQAADKAATRTGLFSTYGRRTQGRTRTWWGDYISTLA